MNAHLSLFVACRIVLCPKARGVFGDLFCPEHELEFQASPEGLHPRASSRSDFRDRVWKERCKLDEETKRAQLERDTREKP